MKRFYLWVLVLFYLVACQPAQVVVVTATPEATKTPAPTQIPTETVTPSPEPTPTPQGQIFFEGFSEALQPGWNWINENPENWKLTESGWLWMKSDDMCLLNERFQNNLLMRMAPAEGNFRIETYVNANTTANFQQASLYLFEDESNYFSINRGFCDLCPPRGDGIFSDYMYKNKWNSFNGRGISEAKVWLRIDVNRDKKQIIAYYATEEGNWVQLRKVPLSLNISQVGLGTSNCEQFGNEINLLSLFDYFVVRQME